ncbi:CHASE2 domain-containing protein [Candidatus Albibeggiatoa sp. nov. BB20]|uniref:CHASE2 domain-containing protein n=1 Tax=Candidatus Albibeggiatoa sp. nov. BB20 TaxID=3162723 RepID=UPI003365321E
MLHIGVGNLTARYSQDIFNVAFGSYSWVYNNAGQKQVSVVLLGDDALSEMGEEWPATYKFHARILDFIRARKPKAVMIDFLFLGHCLDSTAKELVRILKKYKRDQIPVYLAVSQPNDLESISRAFQIKQNVDIADYVIPVSVVKKTDATDFVDRQYPLKGMFAKESEQEINSAAYQIYQDFELQSQDIYTQNIELFWGVGQDPINSKWMGSDCQDTWYNNFQRVLYAGLEKLDYKCIYTRSLSALDLLTFGVSNDDIQAVLNDKFVFYGGNILGSGDIATTSLHTMLPGIYYHAMALDNLLTLGEHYKRRSLAPEQYYLYNTFLILMFFSLATFSYYIRLQYDECIYNQLRTRLNQNHQWLYYYSLHFLVSFLIIISFSIVSFYFFNLAVANWLGHTSLIATGLSDKVVTHAVSITKTIQEWAD